MLSLRLGGDLQQPQNFKGWGQDQKPRKITSQTACSPLCIFFTAAWKTEGWVFGTQNHRDRLVRFLVLGTPGLLPTPAARGRSGFQNTERTESGDRPAWMATGKSRGRGPRVPPRVGGWTHTEGGAKGDPKEQREAVGPGSVCEQDSRPHSAAPCLPASILPPGVKIPGTGRPRLWWGPHEFSLCFLTRPPR